ncbi:hypothetical protein [Phytomonospora endophytica]|uniref:FHA domain-containing protein n=1 Tax=Phytomonospora endophytica TaxID=714109 RepID=A0A841FZD3_9ACTN|nr:hypothetical protein [Phytomonospora endophytica]MBB6038727.1 hypothetical protein [Phytomonospora endophytica]GIG68477.1 hypothetical protein Pen01_47720 [Phytomonospora endophytica]
MAADKVKLLRWDDGSLADRPITEPPGTLLVLSTSGGLSVTPDSAFTVLFGRNYPEVHVCVGANDRNVSRLQGRITREHSRWTLSNLGKSPIRMPGAGLVLTGHRAELPPTYAPLSVLSPRQEYLLEVRVVGPRPQGTGGEVFEDLTITRPKWTLSAEERLVVVCLAQRYLRGEPYPQPLTWGRVAEQLAGRHPQVRWNAHRAANIVGRVRRTLHGAGVAGMVEEEIPQPVGNALNHNLIVELMASTTIKREDLALLGEA